MCSTRTCLTSSATRASTCFSPESVSAGSKEGAREAELCNGLSFIDAIAERASYGPPCYEQRPRVAQAVPVLPLIPEGHTSDRETSSKENGPALSTSRLSILDFHASHVLLVSQSSLPQQQVARSGGSGEDPREKFPNANVRSSMLWVMRWKLLDKGDSGVDGRCREAIVSRWPSVFGGVYIVPALVADGCMGCVRGDDATTGQ